MCRPIRRCKRLLGQPLKVAKYRLLNATQDRRPALYARSNSKTSEDSIASTPIGLGSPLQSASPARNLSLPTRTAPRATWTKTLRFGGGL